MTGAVVWITGLPSSGKSTLAARLARRLREERIGTVVLDGDDIRAALVPAPGYGAPDRGAFYATLAHLAALLAGQGLVVIVAATSHLRAYRDRARALAQRFVEVFVDVPPDECQRRDTKGLYARAQQGTARDVPGADATYERPDAPDAVATGGADDAALEKVAALIRGHNT